MLMSFVLDVPVAGSASDAVIECLSLTRDRRPVFDLHMSPDVKPEPRHTLPPSRPIWKRRV